MHPWEAQRSRARYHGGMIRFVEGTVKEISPLGLVVTLGGIGFFIRTTREASQVALGSVASLHTYLAVREDALELYGFPHKDELSFFELLLSVSGIGPRSALAILGMGDLEAIRRAIGSGDTHYLTKVSGIGRKTAERIVVELRDKVGTSRSGESSAEDVDVLEALLSLGYGAKEAREALKTASKEAAGTKDKLKEALKRLSSRAS